jgi:hypothetical protein
VQEAINITAKNTGILFLKYDNLLDLLTREMDIKGP